MKLISLFLISILMLAFAACDSGTRNENTPEIVLKNFIEAKKIRDPEAIKKTISADSLKMIADMAKEQSTSVEALLTDNRGMAAEDLPVTRNVEIKGDEATLEAQAPQTKEWQKIWFVKENGEWKVALDKAVIEGMKKVQETLKNLPNEPSESLPDNSTDNNTNEIEANK